MLVGTPGYESIGKDDVGQFMHKLIFSFSNYGECPVLDVQAEAWGAQQPLDEPPLFGTHTRIMQSGAEGTWPVNIVTPVPQFSMGAFRYRWTDADGLQWFIDQREQPGPLLYEGQPPRRY